MITFFNMDKVAEFAPKPKEGEPWDVIIIGSGPAGLTAAIYTTRGAASTLVLGGEAWGGQLMLTTGVDNYPGFPEGIEGPDLMAKMRKQAERFGVEFIEKNVGAVDFSKRPFKVTAAGAIYLAKSVIIATGAETRWLGVAGENKLRGRGVSSCAPCDAPFFKGKRVVVVGGGDSALEEALVLIKYATLVILVHRRDQLKASAAMQEKVIANQKIKIIWDTEVVEILGEEKTEKVLLKTKTDSKQAQELKGGKVGGLGGRVIEEKDNLLFWEIPLDGLFVAIGYAPSTKIFAKQIELDEKGYIKTMANDQLPMTNGYKMSTSVSGVFVAGDVHDYHYRQAVTAAGFGCMAGLEALKYLDEIKEGDKKSG